MTQPTYKPFPLINLLASDEKGLDGCVRFHHHNSGEQFAHVPFPTNTVFDLYAKTRNSANAELVDDAFDVINLGTRHELVVRDDEGAISTRPIELQLTHDTEGNHRIVTFGGPAVGVMGEVNLELGTAIITCKDTHVIGVYLGGDRRRRDYNEPSFELSGPVAEAVTTDVGAYKGTTLKQLLAEEDQATLRDVGAAMADSHIDVENAIDTVASVGYVALRGTNVQEVINELDSYFTAKGYTFEVESGAKENGDLIESQLFRLTGDFRLTPVDVSLSTLRKAVAQIECLWIGERHYNLTALRSPDDVRGRIRLIDNRQFEYLLDVGGTDAWDTADFETDALQAALQQVGETLNALIQIRHGAEFRFEIVEAEGIEVVLPVAPWEVVGHSAPGTRLVVGIPRNVNLAVEGFDANAALRTQGLPDIVVAYADWQGKLAFVDEPNALTEQDLAVRLTFSGDQHVFVKLDGPSDLTILTQVQQWMASFLGSYLQSAGLLNGARLYSVETNTGLSMLANPSPYYSADQLGPYLITISA